MNLTQEMKQTKHLLIVTFVKRMYNFVLCFCTPYHEMGKNGFENNLTQYFDALFEPLNEGF